MTRDTRVQIERYLAGGMATEESAAFLESLRAEPEALTFLGEAIEQQAHLFDLLNEGAAAPETVAPRSGDDRSPMASRQGPPAAAGPTARARRWVAVAAAACLAGLAGIVALTRSSGTPPARLEHVQGDVRIIAGGGEEPRRVQPGQALSAGQSIETFGDNAVAVLVCHESARLELGADTKATCGAAGRGIQVSLDRGVLQADVSRQARGFPVVLSTPHADVSVLGTRFALRVTAKATIVEVEEGRVRMTRARDGAAAEVGAGRRASAAGDAPIDVQPLHIWRSFDVAMTPEGPHPAVVPDLAGLRPAHLEFYESGDDHGVSPGTPLATFFREPHRDTIVQDLFNHVDQYWTHPLDPRQYPYAGKSTAPRGRDSGERGAPPPLDVLDFQLHPPENRHLVVAAFVAPADGVYRVGDLAARRVDRRGGRARFCVFDAARRPLADLVASKDRAWVREPRSFSLGPLRAGDRIYFAVGNEDKYAWDATEVAWTVTATEP